MMTTMPNVYDALYNIANNVYVGINTENQSTAFIIKTKSIDLIKKQLSNLDDYKIVQFFCDDDSVNHSYILLSKKGINVINSNESIAFIRQPIQGTLLDEALNESDISTSKKLDIIKRIAEAVKEAGDNANLYHGWLNPKNIYILNSGDDNRVEVAITGWEEFTFTSEAFMNLPENSNSTFDLFLHDDVKEFASPEVIKQQSPDFKSEVYSLGILFNKLFESEYTESDNDYFSLYTDCCHNEEPEKRISIDRFIFEITKLIQGLPPQITASSDVSKVERRFLGKKFLVPIVILLLILSNIFFAAGWRMQYRSNHSGTTPHPDDPKPDEPSTPELFNIIYDWECNNNHRTKLIASFNTDSNVDKSRKEELINKIQPSLVNTIALIKNSIVSSNNDLFENTWSAVMEQVNLKDLSEEQQKQILEMLIGAIRQECFKPNSNRSNSLIDTVKKIIQDKFVYSESLSYKFVADTAKDKINKLLKELISKTNSTEHKNYLDYIYHLCDSFKGSPDEQLHNFCKDYKNWWESEITISFVHIAAACNYIHGGFIDSVTCNDKPLSIHYYADSTEARRIEYSPDLKKPNKKIFNLDSNSTTIRPRDGIKLDLSCRVKKTFSLSNKVDKSYTIYPFIIHNTGTDMSVSFPEFKSEIDLTLRSNITGKCLEDIYKNVFGEKEYNSIFGTEKTSSKPKTPAKPKPAKTKAAVEPPKTASDQSANKEK